MPKVTMDWDDFMVTILEGLDGIDYRTAKRIHEILYPDQKVRTAPRNQVEIEYPSQGNPER
jgi:hypothetical protein